MADKNGHITLETKFGGGLRLAPKSKEYGAIRDKEGGERRKKIELFADAIKLDEEMREIWDDE